VGEKVIDTKTGMKGCLFTCGISFVLFVLSVAGYLIYVFFIDDSLPY